METILQEVLRIAKTAGTLIERSSNQRADSQFKADGSPVSGADLAADDFIRNALMKLTPDTPIISEESAIPAYKVRKNWKRFWLVDGLDGTKEFLAGRDEYTVNIALIEHRSPVMGVIRAPRKKISYFASKEGGSWKVALILVQSSRSF